MTSSLSPSPIHVSLPCSPTDYWTSISPSSPTIPSSSLSLSLSISFSSLSLPIHLFVDIVDFVISTSSPPSSSPLPSPLLITKEEFTSFCLRFSPSPSLITASLLSRLLSSLFSPSPSFLLHSFYYGEISREEAETILLSSTTPLPSFLLRTSAKFPNKLTLSYVKMKDDKKAIKNSLIYNVGEGKYSFEEKGAGGENDILLLMKTLKMGIDNVPSQKSHLRVKIEERQKIREIERKKQEKAESNNSSPHTNSMYSTFGDGDEEEGATTTTGTAGNGTKEDDNSHSNAYQTFGVE